MGGEVRAAAIAGLAARAAVLLAVAAVALFCRSGRLAAITGAAAGAGAAAGLWAAALPAEAAWFALTAFLHAVLSLAPGLPWPVPVLVETVAGGARLWSIRARSSRISG